MKVEIKRADGTVVTVEGDAAGVARVVRDALDAQPPPPVVVPVTVPWSPPSHPGPGIPYPTIWWGLSHPATGEPTAPSYTVTCAEARDWKDIDPIFAPSLSCTVLS